MLNNYINKLDQEGYFILKDSVSKKNLKIIHSEINSALLAILKSKNNYSLSKNFFLCLKKKNQHIIQKILAKKIFDKNLIQDLLSNNKILNILKNLLGPDLEYLSNSELAINVKGVKNTYFVKKYHQEIWSGVSSSSILIWFPIFLKKGMSTLEIIPGSHKWGMIPNMNREPIKLPKTYKEKILDIKEGSILIMSPFTLHRTVPNIHIEPRIAMPITIRNFYYPQTGNEDLWEFKKLNESSYTKLRKQLGNKLFTPFRTVDINK